MRINLKGEKYGAIKILKDNGDTCLVLCDCGAIVSKSRSSVLNARWLGKGFCRKGCTKTQRSSKALQRHQNAVGKRFGRWTVKGFFVRQGRIQNHYWFNVQCDCGHLQEIYSYNVLQGQSTQCQPCGHANMPKKHPVLVEGVTLPDGRLCLDRIGGRPYVACQVCQKPRIWMKDKFLLCKTCASAARSHQIVVDGLAMNQSQWAKSIGVTRARVGQIFYLRGAEGIHKLRLKYIRMRLNLDKTISGTIWMSNNVPKKSLGFFARLKSAFK